MAFSQQVKLSMGTKRLQDTNKRAATKQSQAAMAAKKASTKAGAIKSTDAAAKQKAFTKSASQTAIRNISNETGMKRGVVNKMAVDGKNSNYSSKAYRNALDSVSEGDTKAAKRYDSQLKKTSKKCK